MDEAEHYAEDVRELNRTQPGWDRESKVMAARRVLAEPGMDEGSRCHSIVSPRWLRRS